MLGFLFGTTQILSLENLFSLSKKTSGNSNVSIKDVELDSIIFVLDPVKSTNDRMERGNNLPGDNALNELLVIQRDSIT